MKLFKLHNINSRGQSLVETALFLPLLIMLIAGVVEISNMLATQSRVATSARAATGYGASSINENAWTANSDWAASMATVGQNSVNANLDMDPARWDIFTIKGTTNADGDGFDVFLTEHPVGEFEVISEDEWNGGIEALKSELITKLTEDNVSAADLEIVATVVNYDSNSVLGLPVVESLANGRNLRSTSVMRLDSPPDYASCPLIPIALNFNNFSLYPEDYSGDPLNYPNTDPIRRYQEDDWEFPPTMPAYSTTSLNPFGLHAPGWPVSEAQYGYIYEAREDGDAQSGDNYAGAFGWLTWDGSTSATALDDSLTYPGNLSLVPPPEGPGTRPDGTQLVNYINPHDPDDYIPEPGDWVQGATGNVHSAASLLQVLYQKQMILVPMFDQVEGQGSNFNYHIVGFAKVKILAYQMTGNDKRILVSYIGDGSGLCSPN